MIPEKEPSPQEYKVEFIFSSLDFDDLGIPSEIRNELKDRIERRGVIGISFGTHFWAEKLIAVYPHLIAKEFSTEERIMKKMEYTLVHEFIHGFLFEIARKFNNEENAHAYAMLLTQNEESNSSGSGKFVLALLKKLGYEIEV